MSEQTVQDLSFRELESEMAEQLPSRELMGAYSSGCCHPCCPPPPCFEADASVSGCGFEAGVTLN